MSREVYISYLLYNMGVIVNDDESFQIARRVYLVFSILTIKTNTLLTKPIYVISRDDAG